MIKRINIAILCLLMVLLFSCAYTTKNKRTFVGWGKVEYNDKGQIVSMESAPPLKIEIEK